MKIQTLFPLLLLCCALMAAPGSISVSAESVGFPFIVQSSDNQEWQVSGGRNSVDLKGTTAAPIRLMAGNYAFRINDRNVGSFTVSHDGLVGDRNSRSEVFEFTARGETIGKIMIPDGESIKAARLALQATMKPLYDEFLTATNTAPWKRDFVLEDLMQIHAFPEDQVAYLIEDLPTDKKDLTLLVFADEMVYRIPYQFSQDVSGKKTICFRTDLPLGAKRLFRLIDGMDLSRVPQKEFVPMTLTQNEMSNSRVKLRFPTAAEKIGTPLASVDAPIVSMTSVDSGNDQLRSSFQAPAGLVVDRLSVKTLESGPLFVQQEIRYDFQDQGRSYRVILELRANEEFVRVAEYFEGFSPGDGAFLRVDFGKGLLEVDQHYAYAEVGGYGGSSCGDYAEVARPIAGNPSVKEIGNRVGLYAANDLGVTRAGVVFPDKGPTGAFFVVDRLNEWKTAVRGIWSSHHLIEAFRFRSHGDARYAVTGMSGKQKFWVVGLAPRTDIVVDGLRNNDGRLNIRPYKLGIELVVFKRLGDWNLQECKDRMEMTRVWDEPFNDPFDSKAHSSRWLRELKVLTYGEYVAQYFNRYSGGAPLSIRPYNAVEAREAPRAFSEYAKNRASWTPAQREHVRQVLAWLADSCNNDFQFPQRSMLAGQPNFLMDVKVVVPVAALTFKTHPRAKGWRDDFMECLEEALHYFVRKDNTELNTVGGRYTENIACYMATSLIAYEQAMMALKAYDGTTFDTDPNFIAWMNWLMAAYMSPHEGVRRVPTQGAHSRNMDPGNIPSQYVKMVAHEIAKNVPKVSEGLLWVHSNGKEGVNPKLQSTLFTDYGPVMRYDFGGQNESYAHLQNIYGSSYRWGGAGMVFYGAKNKIWSLNTAEENGDNRTPRLLSQFLVTTNDESEVFKDVSEVIRLTEQEDNTPQGLAGRLMRQGVITELPVKSKILINTGDVALSSTPTNQLLYDFDFVQFYRQPNADEAQAPYRARAMMLVRDDYLVLSDEVATPQTPGRFGWVNVFDLPEFYQLKPGARGIDVEYTESNTHRFTGVGGGTNEPRTAKVKIFNGKGDFLTVVAPPGGVAKAEATDFGGIVNGEYVFASQKPVENDRFAGTYGYARKNQIALFQGTRVRFDDLGLTREGGDFGASAEVKGGKIVGRLVGKSGGTLSVTPPAGFLKGNNVTVLIDGKPVQATVQNNTVTFAVAIAQRDGLKYYDIQP